MIVPGFNTEPQPISAWSPKNAPIFLNPVSIFSFPLNNELFEVLESLGYKKPDINKVIKDIDSSKTIEEQIKDALKLMVR